MYKWTKIFLIPHIKKILKEFKETKNYKLLVYLVVNKEGRIANRFAAFYLIMLISAFALILFLGCHIFTIIHAVIS
jgi:hypothetical protein